MPAPLPPIQVHLVPSADGRSILTAYLWRPKPSGRRPAVVLLHGRRGPYSTTADGFYTARTLSRRHRAWGELWAKEGYLALLVDSYGARGYPQGFPCGSYHERPPEVSEKTVRPLDAYGALGWLRGRSDVDPDRIGLQGWSNGGMAGLWTMSTFRLTDRGMTAAEGFRAALIFYPSCSRLRDEEPAFKPYAPIRMFVAGEDKEVNPKTCVKFAHVVVEAGGPLQVIEFPEAHHDFDNPASKDAADKAAAAAARESAREFLAIELGS